MTAKNVVRLQFTERMALAEWLKKSLEIMVEQGMHCSAIASTATDDLGFHVTDNHVRYLASQLNLKLTPENGSRGLSLSKLQSRIAHLEASLTNVSDRLIDLERGALNRNCLKRIDLQNLGAGATG